MQTWIDAIVHGGNGMAMAFGVLGALIAYAITSRLGLHNGFRLVLAVTTFAVLLVLGGSAPGQRTAVRFRNTRIGEMFSRREPRDVPSSPPLWKYGGVASDTTGAAIASFLEDALRELRGDSVVCVNFLYSVLHSRVPLQLSIGLDIRFRKLTARVVEEGQRSPRPRVDSRSAVTLGRMMVTRLRESHGQRRAREILTVMSDPANGLSKPGAVCNAATAVYSTIADMPPSDGGKLMRHMLERQAVAPTRAPHLRP